MRNLDIDGMKISTTELKDVQDGLTIKRHAIIVYMMCVLQELDPDNRQLVFSDHGGSTVPQYPIDESIELSIIKPFDALQIIYFDGHLTEFVRHGHNFTRLIHLSDNQLISLSEMVQSFYVRTL